MGGDMPIGSKKLEEEAFSYDIIIINYNIFWEIIIGARRERSVKKICITEYLNVIIFIRV